jgi:hypothetical protein
MPALVPRLRRRVDRDRWIAIGEGSNPSTTFPQGITNARVEGPPNFLDPIAAEEEGEEEESAISPPTYSQVRSVTRPEIARLIPNRGPSLATSQRETDVSTAQTTSQNAVTSSNLTDLNDIRHEDVGSHLHMDGRLSTVPHYPVFTEPPPRNPSRRRQSRRPASIASTSTTTVFLAVAQLPGTEPFERAPPPADMYQSASSKSSTPISRAQPSPASSVGAVAAVSGPLMLQPDPIFGQAANVNEISWFWDDLSQEYWKPPDRGYYGPQARANFRHTRTWPNRSDSINVDQRRSIQLHLPLQRPASPDPEGPPAPPPKDPGYVARPRHHGREGHIGRLRQSRSSPQLQNYRSDNDRRGEIGGFDTPARTATDLSSPPTSRATQIFDACARFISRSFPRVALYKGS